MIKKLIKILQLLAGEDPLLEENEKLKLEIEGLRQKIEASNKTIERLLETQGQYTIPAPIEEYLKCQNQQEKNKLYDSLLNHSGIPKGGYTIAPMITSKGDKLELKLSVVKAVELDIKETTGEAGLL